MLHGARQTGKTWLMEQFGKHHFDYCVKYDFDRSPELKEAFANSKSPERILKELAIYSDVPIQPGRTLIIFDEIQECEAALNSLKYFCEEAPQYHVMAAGSLLGVAVKRRKMTVPVGKVKMMRMYPLTFKEFLRAGDGKTFDCVEGLEQIRHLPAEVEFVIAHQGEVVPLEVKAEGNVGGKSLAVYETKYHPRWRVRFSANNMQRNGNLQSLPSPLAGWLPKWLTATAQTEGEDGGEQ